MTDDPRRAIAWFRRDLRLTDNRMLEAAAREAGRVWPVFVADPALLETHTLAAGRIAWFGASLAALDARLRDAGSGLTVLRGPPEEGCPPSPSRWAPIGSAQPRTRTRSPSHAMS